ncbi:MAG: aldo/keto reductase [Anaerolineales bacterium]|nr:aldo/keto reductase [Anaerolineales bacterium]
MQTRKLGFTDMEITTIGFGAWAVGGQWDWGWGAQDDAESIAAIQRGLDLGINWIDTAAAYGLGHSEEVVQKALKGRRGQVYIATKCGLVWDDPSTGKVNNRLKAWSVRQEVENSLRRLGVDVIDLYQIHWPNPDVDIEEGWTEIARLVEEGKVRYAGTSNFSVEQLRRVQKIHPVASLQPEYSMLERSVEKDLLAYCAENQIGVVAYSPMASGLLTGKYTRTTLDSIAVDDWRRKYNEHFREPALTANLSFVEKLEEIASRYKRTPGELAVAWVLRRPEIAAAIVGARRPSQIEQTISASNWQLPIEMVNEIEHLLDVRDSRIAAQTTEV